MIVGRFFGFQKSIGKTTLFQHILGMKKALAMKLEPFPNIRLSYLISKKGSEKGSDSDDLYCNLLKINISRIALNQAFSTCAEM